MQLTEGVAWGGNVWLEQEDGQKAETKDSISGITVCIPLNAN